MDTDNDSGLPKPDKVLQPDPVQMLVESMVDSVRPVLIAGMQSAVDVMLAQRARIKSLEDRVEYLQGVLTEKEERSDDG